ncbi:MAG: hypothetical protein WB473_14685, partial [Pedococcus sp.]
GEQCVEVEAAGEVRHPEVDAGQANAPVERPNRPPDQVSLGDQLATAGGTQLPVRTHDENVHLRPLASLALSPNVRPFGVLRGGVTSGDTSTHPADVLDGLMAAGREPGGAVAVVRDGVVEVDLQDASLVEYDDRQALVDLVEQAAPVHPPGAEVAEHALTYGHLLDAWRPWWSPTDGGGRDTSTTRAGARRWADRPGCSSRWC